MIDYDESIQEAKKILLEAIQKKQSTLTGIRPPDPKLKEEYERQLNKFSDQRGSKLWFPYLGSGIGKGTLVQLMDGSVKYDFIGGIGVHHFGHNHPALMESTLNAAVSDVIMQGNLQQNQDQFDLVDLFIKQSGMDHCFLSTTGSMANENALKIAFQKNHPASRILAFERSFCGRTWAMSQATEKPNVREGLPLSLGVDFVPFYNPEDPENSTKKAVEVLKKYIVRYPKQHAMMIFELVQGEGGFYPGSTPFFRALMEVLKDNHIAIMADEVQTFGRTSKLFAYQHFGLEDLVDIVTLGKLALVCATLYKTEYNPRPQLLSQTFTSSTQAINASKTVINLLLTDGFFGENGKNMEVNRHFVRNFEAIASRHPGLIKGPYGLGGMVAFTPLDGQPDRVTQLVHNLFDNGVMSFICGKNPARARFLVPVGAATKDDIDKVSAILERTLLCS